MSETAEVIGQRSGWESKEGSTGAAGSDFTIVLGPEHHFAAIRRFFHEVDFGDVSVCKALGIESMGELGQVQPGTAKLESCERRLRWCIWLFVLGQKSEETESHEICGGSVFDALKQLGLLRSSTRNPRQVLCPIWLYPADGFLIASDRREDPEGAPFSPAADVVFPAIYPGTLRFLRLLPEVRGEDALDLCGGTGIGALRLSRTARAAVTADLTERSAFFAEFNARLNGARVTSLCGDLYSPVQGRQFAAITAHPPFVPATGDTMVYRDGGSTGEEVTRRVIEGVPAHLLPGGDCVILCVARDTEDQMFEQRARDWLGNSRDEFEIVFGLEKILSVEKVVDSMRKRGQQLGDAQAEALLNRLQSMRTRQFVYGALWIKRRGQKADTQVTSDIAVHKPRRVRMTPAGSAVDFERLLAWRERCRQPGFQEWLANSRPRLASELQLRARHVVKNGELVPAEFIFSIETGFEAALHPDGWVVPLIARFEGKLSVSEVYEQALQAEEMPNNFGLTDFVGLVSMMIDRGFLEVNL